MDEKKKKLFYGVITGIAILLSICLSIFLNIWDKHRAQEEQIEQAAHEQEQAEQEKENKPSDNKTDQDPEKKEETNTEDLESGHQVEKDTERWEAKKEELETYIASTKPEFSGATKEIKKKFLNDNTDTFWHELGIFLYENFGKQQVVSVKFLKYVSNEDEFERCTLEVKNDEGDPLYVLGSYNPKGNYYEFYLIPDIETYDPEDIGEGGL